MAIITIHNAQTNEIIEREMNDLELSQWQSDFLKAESEKLARAEIAAAKAALLQKLGITEDEAKLLLA